MIAWELYPTTGQLILSPNAENVLGVRWTSTAQPIAAANPADIERARTAYESAAATGQPFVCDVRTVNLRTQREVCLEIRGHTVRSSGGSIIEVTGVATDVTHRRVDEQAQGHLAAIVQSSDDAIISVSTGGTVLTWNSGAARLLGYASEEVIGQSITMFIPPELRGESQSLLARAMSGEHVAPYETIRVAKDGRRIDVSVRLSPMFNRAAHVIGVSKIARDITERRRAFLRQSASTLGDVPCPTSHKP